MMYPRASFYDDYGTNILHGPALAQLGELQLKSGSEIHRSKSHENIMLHKPCEVVSDFPMYGTVPNGMSECCGSEIILPRIRIRLRACNSESGSPTLLLGMGR